MLHISEAKALPGHRLYVRFSDGHEGEVDLSRELTGPVFAPLADDEQFNRVEVHALFHTVTWSNGADLAPECLRELLDRQHEAVA